MLRYLLALALLALAACTESPNIEANRDARILAMGDSMLAWNSAGGNSISHAVERQLNTQVVDRSVTAARVLYALPISGALGLKIAKQLVPGPWEWVIMNGGGNDLWLGCGCGKCNRKMDRMISPGGQEGEIPKLIQKLRTQQTKVIYLGYLRTPGKGSLIDHCKQLGDQFEARLAVMAASDPGVFFISNQDLVPHGDLTFHAVDRIHPSAKGSAAIARRISKIIRHYSEHDAPD